MKKLVKIGIDLVESLTLTNVLDTKFWQDLIITLIVIVINAVVIPLLKSLYSTILTKMHMKGIINDEEFKQYCIDKDIKINEEDVKTLLALYQNWKESRNNINE